MRQKDHELFNIFFMTVAGVNGRLFRYMRINVIRAWVKELFVNF